MTIPVVKRNPKDLFVDVGRWDSPGQFKGSAPKAKDKEPKPPRPQEKQQEQEQ